MGEQACPFCGEMINSAVAKCPHCDELLNAPEPKKGMSGLLIAAIVLGVSCLLCVPVGGIVAAIAIPNLIEARKHGNEVSAIGALKTIGSAQMLFREMDKDGNDKMDYGTLDQLAQHGLIDSVLGSGMKQGFMYEVVPSPTDPEFMWYAMASPAVPQTTGDRFFFTCHEGVIYYTVNDPGEMPMSAQPGGTWRVVGK